MIREDRHDDVINHHYEESKEGIDEQIRRRLDQQQEGYN